MKNILNVVQNATSKNTQIIVDFFLCAFLLTEKNSFESFGESGIFLPKGKLGVRSGFLGLTNISCCPITI